MTTALPPPTPPPDRNVPLAARAAILLVMGFNPHRQVRRSAADYLMVGAALVICVGLVLWALLG